MIVRILGEGQYEVAESSAALLEQLDARVDAALDAGDTAAFDAALAAAIAAVRREGKALEAERIIPSDLALPAEHSTLEEVCALLEAEAAEA